LVAIQFISKDIKREIEFNMRLLRMNRYKLVFIMGRFYLEFG
jgi:hypothetical protein